MVQGHDHPWLLSHGARAPATRAGSRATPPARRRATRAKTRYRQADAACTLRAGDGRRFALDFAEPQWAVTPGQSAVLYDGEVCLGGGVIDGGGPPP